MSLEAMKWAFEQTVGRSADKLILLSLSDRAGEEHLVWPSHERLSRDTELNKKTIKEGLKRLREIGFIRDTGERRGLTQRVVVYQLMVGAKIINEPKNGSVKQAQKRPNIMGPKTETNEPKNGPLNGPKNGPQNLSLESTKEPIKNTCTVGTERCGKTTSDNQPVQAEIIEHLNTVSGKTFRVSEASLKPINGRLSEGYTPEDLNLVSDHKTVTWSKDPRMRDYLRPITIFGKEKFDGYLQAAKQWDQEGRPANEHNQHHNSYQQPKLSTVERNSQQCREYEQRLLREIAELEAEENRGASDSLVVANG